MEKRFFDDLKDGDILNFKTVVMTREDIIHFGKKFDPQLFHIDENAAINSLFGGLIASSLHTLSACTRVVVGITAKCKGHEGMKSHLRRQV